jgi:hypothetical protein
MMMTRTSPDDLWHDDDALEQMLGVLMRHLLQADAIDDDGTARLCLTPRELAGLLSTGQQTNHAQDTLEGLADFLEEDGPVQPLAGAIRDWRVSIEQRRARFGWLELPPALRKRAHHRAKALLLAGEDRGWLVQSQTLWRLTEQGRNVARGSQ